MGGRGASRGRMRWRRQCAAQGGEEHRPTTFRHHLHHYTHRRHLRDTEAATASTRATRNSRRSLKRRTTKPRTPAPGVAHPLATEIPGERSTDAADVASRRRMVIPPLPPCGGPFFGWFRLASMSALQRLRGREEGEARDARWGGWSKGDDNPRRST
jgi:hypothetical protein